jgi:hypothetical protein
VIRQAVDAHESRDEAGRPWRLGLRRRRGGFGAARVGARRQGVEHRLDLHADLHAIQQRIKHNSILDKYGTDVE